MQEKPLHYVEPGGKSKAHACPLQAQPNRRRGDAQDVAEEIRDACPGDKRRDDPSGQRSGKKQPGTASSFLFSTPRDMARVFPAIRTMWSLLGASTTLTKSERPNTAYLPSTFAPIPSISLFTSLMRSGLDFTVFLPSSVSELSRMWGGLGAR